MGPPESGDVPIDDEIDVVEDAESSPGLVPAGEPISRSGRHERTPTATIVRQVRDLPAVARYGRYQLLGRIAFGGMAEIFLAREDTAAGAARTVVIKRILPHVADDEGFVQMFLGEARIAMRLSHPGIVHLYEFGEQDGTWFIAMEWVNGVSLGKLIKASRATAGVPPRVAAKVIAAVADALHHAHRAVGDDGEPLGIVHRDVSPQNVMIGYDGQVKLLDFGVAKASIGSTRTDAGVVKGKLAYMAPEQCRGAEIDARADVFALGVCLYEALVGRHLYARATDFETMKAVIEEPVPRVRALKPDIPEELDAIVRRALAKGPAERYETAGDFADALEGFLAGQADRVTPARLGAHVTAIFADEIKQGVQLQTTAMAPSRDSLAPSGERLLRSGQVPAVEARPSHDPTRPLRAVSPEPEPKRGARVGLVVALAVVLLGVLAGGSALAWWAVESGALATRLGRVAVAHGPQTTGPAAPPDVAPRAEVVPEEPTGAARFDSDPPGAVVLVDDIEVPGTTPVRVADLALGTHTVEMQAVGHAAWRTEMVIEAGREATVSGTLEAAPAAAPAVHRAPPGQLAINTRPWSKVYLGGRLLGTTPIGNADVPSGDISLRLVDRDGETHRVHVHVTPGERATAFFDLAAPAPQ